MPPPGSTLKPLETPMSKMEINRAIHARVQEWDLPGSPAGQKAPGMLSKVAQSNYGTKNFWALSPDQMMEIHEYLDKNRTWPVNGELKPR